MAVKQSEERLVRIQISQFRWIQLSPDCILSVRHFDRRSTGYGGSLAEQYRQFLEDRFGELQAPTYRRDFDDFYSALMEIIAVSVTAHDQHIDPTQSESLRAVISGSRGVSRTAASPKYFKCTASGHSSTYSWTKDTGRSEPHSQTQYFDTEDEAYEAAVQNARSLYVYNTTLANLRQRLLDKEHDLVMAGKNRKMVKVSADFGLPYIGVIWYTISDRYAFSFRFGRGGNISYSVSFPSVPEEIDPAIGTPRFRAVATRSTTITKSAGELMQMEPVFRSDHMIRRFCFDCPERSTPVEPYFLGLWLGDGSRGSTGISTIDAETILSLEEHATRKGMVLRRRGTGILYATVPATRGQPNLLLRALRRLRVALRQCHERPVADPKHIPLMYMCNSRAIRLELLAGLMDSDGHYYHRRQRFSFTQCLAHKRLFFHVVRLAQSLGFHVTWSGPQYGGKTSRPGRLVIYYEATIVGNIKIPCRLPRKIVPADINRISNTWSINMRLEDSEDECIRIIVNGDGRFLSDDYFVLAK